MAEFEDSDLERRLDRAIEAAAAASPDEALDVLKPLADALAQQIDRLPGSAFGHDELSRCLVATADAHARGGRLDAALGAIEEAVAASRRAELVDPLGGSRDGPVAAIRLRRAVFLTQAGLLDAALAEAEIAAGLVEARCAPDEDGESAHLHFIAADARRHLAWLYPRVGHPERELPNREKALVHGRNGLALERTDGALRAHAATLREISRPRTADGDLQGGLRALADARRLLEEGANRHPSDPSWTREIAITRAWAGRLLRDAGHIENSERELDAAVFVTENLLAMHPDDALVRAEYVRRLEERGDLAYQAGDGEAAITAYRVRSDAVAELLGADPLEEGRALLDLARAQGTVGDHAAAVAALERAAATLETIDSSDLNARETLADVWGAIADAQRDADTQRDADRERTADADDGDPRIAALRRCADVRRELHEAVPAHEHAAVSVMLALGNLGDALRDAGRLDESAAAHAEELAIAEARAARDGDHEAAWSEVAVAEAALSMTQELQGRTADALGHAQAALAARRRIVVAGGAADPDGLLRVVCWDLRRVARLLAGVGALDDAIGLVSEAIATAEAQGAGAANEPAVLAWGQLEAACRDTRGTAFEDAERLEDALAERDRERALARRLAALGGDDADAWWNVARADTDAALLAARLDRRDEALARHDDAVAARERVLEFAPDSHLGVRRELGIALYARAWERQRSGDLPAALADAERSLVLDCEVLAASPDDRAFQEAVAASLNAVAWIAHASENLERFEEAARDEVTLRRVLVESRAARSEIPQSEDAQDLEALGWALYAHAAALRDRDRAAEARPVADEGVALAEALHRRVPDALSVLGLISNLAEVAADVSDRDDPSAAARAKALYARSAAIHREHEPETIGHDSACTCLADSERKLAALE